MTRRIIVEARHLRRGDERREHDAVLRVIDVVCYPAWTTVVWHRVGAGLDELRYPPTERLTVTREDDDAHRT